MDIWALIPVKSLQQSKRRLAHLLPAARRAELISGLLQRELRLLNQVPAISRVLIISSDPTIWDIARQNGALVEKEPQSLGLNIAVARGKAIAAEKGASAVLILPVDLPFISVADIDLMVRSRQESRSWAAEQPWSAAAKSAECGQDSSQAGCAMGCGFCATGQAGFTRHLTVGEIVEQVVRTAQRAKAMRRRVSNIVFMGMGEPMANLDPVWAATERFHGDLGMSARHITISTVGVIPGIRSLRDRPLPVNLAVSLHAANDELRNELVPINKRYPIDDLLAACDDYLQVKHRRVSFEWAMIDGVNDRDRDARELAALCRRLSPHAHVNLIPLNPTPGYPTTGSARERVEEFRDLLEEIGANATVRRNRGTDIDAACGQLAAGQPVVLGTRRR